MPKKTYVTICVCLYHENLAELDRQVTHCKKSGLTKMNRSRLIRAALKRLDLTTITPGDE